jgi:hypothetical protein
MKKVLLISLTFLSSFPAQNQPFNQPQVQTPQFYQQYPGMHQFYRKKVDKAPSKLTVVGISVGVSVVTATLVATIVSFVMCKVRL